MEGQLKHKKQITKLKTKARECPYPGPHSGILEALLTTDSTARPLTTARPPPCTHSLNSTMETAQQPLNQTLLNTLTAL